MRKSPAGQAAVLACALIVTVIACNKGNNEPQGSATTETGMNKAVPKIAAVEPIHSFGKAKQGQNVEHVFKIKNEGQAELRIEKARGS